MSSKRSPATVVRRTEQRLSMWVRVVNKQVKFAPGQRSQRYHCMAQADYIAIVAKTRSGLIPLVRQYRPAVEAYTWELPAGLLEEGERPEQACRRELLEETGLKVDSLAYLGARYADTGRLENRLHAFFVRASDSNPSFKPEQGLQVRFFSPVEIREAIRSGKLQHMLHLGVLTLASSMGFEWASP